MILIIVKLTRIMWNKLLYSKWYNIWHHKFTIFRTIWTIEIPKSITQRRTNWTIPNSSKRNLIHWWIHTNMCFERWYLFQGTFNLFTMYTSFSRSSKKLMWYTSNILLTAEQILNGMIFFSFKGLFFKGTLCVVLNIALF